jgi:hypothetical protein
MEIHDLFLQIPTLGEVSLCATSAGARVTTAVHLAPRAGTWAIRVKRLLEALFFEILVTAKQQWSQLREAHDFEGRVKGPSGDHVYRASISAIATGLRRAR